MRIPFLPVAVAAATLSISPAIAGPDYGYSQQTAGFQQVAYDDDDRYYRGRTWRDDRGRVRCRRDDGTVGLLIGGAAGALLGREIDGGRNRAAGTIIGGVAGALLGREIDRSDAPRCE